MKHLWAMSALFLVPGQGTYTTTSVPGGNRVVTRWEGEYAMPE